TGAEDRVQRPGERGVADGVVGRVGDRAVRPKPGVAVASGDALSHDMIKMAVLGGRKSPRGPGHPGAAHRRREERHEDRVRHGRRPARRGADPGPQRPQRDHGNAPSSPASRRSSTTSHAGRPTTLVYEPSIFSTKKQPIPCTAYAPALSKPSPVAA